MHGKTGDGGKAVESFFSELQLKAVETLHVPLLVLAAAGTGKTTVLTQKYVSIAEVCGPGSVMALTFTKKAARELLDRARDLADLASGPVGWMKGARSSIGTFHAIGQKLMRDAYRLGLTLEPPQIADDSELRHYATQALANRHPDDLTPSKKAGEREGRDGAFDLMNAVDRMKNAGVIPCEGGYADASGNVVPTPHGLPPAGSRVHGDAVEYQRLLADAGVMDFSDVILRATHLVNAHRAELLPDLRAVLVDEYQDTNTPQENFIRALAYGLHLTCVGDDDQSIYGWRGANLQNLMRFAEERPNAMVVTLDVNHRCPAEILEHAQRLIGANAGRNAKVVKASKSAKDPRRAVVVHDMGKVFNNTGRLNVAMIKTTFLPKMFTMVCQQAISDGAKARDIACMVRTNPEAQALIQALKGAGIDAVFTNPASTTSPTLRRFAAWLRLIENPRDLSSVATLTATKPGDAVLTDLSTAATREGLPLATYVSQRAAAGSLKQPRFIDFAKAYDGFVAMNATASPIEVATAIAEREGGRRDEIADDDRRRHFWRLFADVVSELADADDLGPAIDVLQSQHVAEDDEERMMDRVEVATIHAMKGRQKPIVVIPFIDDVFPLNTNRQSREGAAEERRLAYVAITRAAEQLHVITASDRASTFLRDAGLAVPV